MKNVFLATHSLENIAGSEVHTLEYAECFIELGWRVYVGSFYISEPYKDKLTKLGVNIIDLLFVDKLYKFDLVWVNHAPVLDFVVSNKNIQAKKIVRNILSPFEPLDDLAGYESNIDLVIVNSEETRDAVLLKAGKLVNIKVINNQAPRGYFLIKEKRNKSLKKLLVVSNHVPDELRAAIRKLVKHGVSVHELGFGSKSRLIEYKDIADADAIVTIGKTVQYSLAARRPVFCYDRFGGPGWITPQNFETAQYFNFSGRCSKKMSSSKLFLEITNNFESALLNLKQLNKVALSRYLLSKTITEILLYLVKSSSSINQISKSISSRSHAYSNIISAHRHSINMLENSNQELNESRNYAQSLSSELIKTQDSIVSERSKMQDMLNNLWTYANNLELVLNKTKQINIIELEKFQAQLNKQMSDYEQLKSHYDDLISYHNKLQMRFKWFRFLIKV